MMQFRSFTDLHAAIMRGLPALPRDIDLVVGIPRSGMLPANIVAMHLNVPLADLDGFLQGRTIKAGNRTMHGHHPEQLFEKARRILVIDDSVGYGTQMRAARGRIAAAGLPYEIIYAAVYVTPESMPLVDLAFEELPWGHCFAWNAMHHPFLRKCCVDIDGVLCVDPEPGDDDDDKNYEAFLRNTKPLFLPSVEIGWLVTGRLAKYRVHTEEWLQRHGVRYRELLMLDLPDVQTKQRLGGGAPFKANVYADTGASLFIESCPREAAVIAKRSGMPVLCVSTQEMVYPAFADRLPRLARNAPLSMVRRLQNKFSAWVRRNRNGKFVTKVSSTTSVRISRPGSGSSSPVVCCSGARTSESEQSVVSIQR